MEQSMVYEGYVKSEGVYQGEGRLLFKNGTAVVWTTTCHQVQFCQISENIAGDTYEGDWVEGVMEGKGVMRYADGDIYEVANFHRNPRFS